MTDTTKKKSTARDRAIAHAAALSERGHTVTLSRLDYPMPGRVVLRIGKRTPFALAHYRAAEAKLAAWVEVL
jgi:hypothetical protein